MVGRVLVWLISLIFGVVLLGIQLSVGIGIAFSAARWLDLPLWARFVVIPVGAIVSIFVLTKPRPHPTDPTPSATNRTASNLSIYDAAHRRLVLGESSKGRGLDALPSRTLFVGAAVFTLAFYGAFLTLLHFVARDSLRMTAWGLQLVGILPITGFVLYWLVRKYGLVYLFTIPFLGLSKWRHPQDRLGLLLPLIHITAQVLWLIALLTEIFAAWTAFWYQQGLLTAGTELSPAQSLVAAEQFYLWNLLDAIPFLAIPDSLHWTLGPTFNDWHSGVLLVFYKLVVIAPLLLGFVALVQQIWEEATARLQAASEAEDEAHSD